MTINPHYGRLLSLAIAAISKIRERAEIGLWSDDQFQSAVRMLENEVNAWVNKNGIDHPQRQDAIDSILASVYSIIESNEHKT